MSHLNIGKKALLGELLKGPGSACARQAREQSAWAQTLLGKGLK